MADLYKYQHRSPREIYHIEKAERDLRVTGKPTDELIEDARRELERKKIERELDKGWRTHLVHKHSCTFGEHPTGVMAPGTECGERGYHLCECGKKRPLNGEWEK